MSSTYRFTPKPSTYKGGVKRSRLEAKWAAFFDRLSWDVTYEPFDGNRYIPDMRVHGDHQFMVEIKPAYDRDGYWAAVPKVTQGLAGHWTHGILIVGDDPRAPSDLGKEIVYSPYVHAGLYGEFQLAPGGVPKWDMEACFWTDCDECSRFVILVGDTCKPCGHRVSEGRRPEYGLQYAMEDNWLSAGNATQWKKEEIRKALLDQYGMTESEFLATGVPVEVPSPSTSSALVLTPPPTSPELETPAFLRKCPETLHTKWKIVYDRVRFEMAKLIMTEPVGDYLSYVADCQEAPDVSWGSVDLSRLRSALDDLCASTEKFLTESWLTPYRHEERLLSEASYRVLFLDDEAERGFNGVMNALFGCRTAVEYLLRADRLDVNDYYEAGPLEWCPDLDDLPDGWGLDECQQCCLLFPSRFAPESEEQLWCSDICRELWWDRMFGD